MQKCLCVICLKILEKNFLKPNKHKQHFEIIDSDYLNNHLRVECFTAKVNILKIKFVKICFFCE